MAGEADRTLVTADTLAVDEGRNDSIVESNAPVTSSSATLAIIRMRDNKAPDMADYWKNQQSPKQITKHIMTSVG
jgi:hypothetical protein